MEPTANRTLKLTLVSGEGRSEETWSAVKIL